MLRLYDYLISGNGYKVRLLLHQLGIPFQRVELDITRGETRTAEFLRMNPNGRIPLLELEDGTFVAESNAIVWYLAGGTPFLPDSRVQQAQALQWMFFEQYSHEPYIAVVRFWAHTRTLAEHGAEVERRRSLGYQALDVMERHLGDCAFFVGGAYSIADIALYAYTHVAEEGGFSLARYPRLCAWLARVRSQPNYIPITNADPAASPAGA